MAVTTAADFSPLDWLARLGPRLVARRDDIERWQRYYDGDQDLPTGPQQNAETYRRFQKIARTNLCKLCVDSRVHRMAATGYRDGTAQGGNDAAIWGLWQGARLDARQFAVYRKAFTQGEAFVIVGPGARRDKPRVTIESALHVIVETDPADSSARLAALRLWHDDLAKRWMATVYMPGWRHHFVAVKESKAGETARLEFTPQAWEVREDPARSTTTIPVFPFRNGDEGMRPRAAFDVGIDVQNRLNLTLLNRLTAERYSAFRQRFLTNYLPEEDPATGLPVPPFNPGADQIITIPPPEQPGDPESMLHDLAQTDTSGMLRGAESDVRAFAAVTITPVYYLPGGDLVNISADAIVALDAGHIASIRESMTAFGESWEDVLACMAELAEVDRELDSAELVWARPEAFNPAAVADYLTKMTGAKVPLTMAVEKIGWTPQEIARLRTELAAESLRASLVAPVTPTPPAGPSAPASAAPAPAARPAAVPPPVPVPDATP